MMDNRMMDDRMCGVSDLPPPEFRHRLIKSARDLEVYKLAYALSLDIHRITLTFPQIEQYALASQLRRSTKSICANIAEGFIKQKYSAPEFRRFLTIAEASASESQAWLQYALDLGYIDESNYRHWDRQYTSVIGMLNNLRAKV